MKRVLILDDDVAIAELMRVVLDEAGFSTVVRSNARDLPTEPIDCVLTDLMSVTLYSFEDARDWILRLRDRFPEVPIVVVTAHGEAVRDGDRLGAQRVIMKPFDVELLPATIRAVTGP